MSSTAKIHVAIYHNQGVDKHWSLFIEGPTKQEKTILHAMGYSTNYHFEMRKSDARNSASLAELIEMCVVPASNIRAINEAGRKTTIASKYPGYNCQDYVLDLLDVLEAKRIIDGDDKNYQEKKEFVKSK